jgi:hypothetical protein
LFHPSNLSILSSNWNMCCNNVSHWHNGFGELFSLEHTWPIVTSLMFSFEHKVKSIMCFTSWKVLFCCQRSTVLPRVHQKLPNYSHYIHNVWSCMNYCMYENSNIIIIMGCLYFLNTLRTTPIITYYLYYLGLWQHFLHPRWLVYLLFFKPHP